MHVFYEALELSAPDAIDASRTTMYGGYFQMEPDGREQLPPKIETPESESYSNIITWHFPKRGEQPELQMHWYDGGMRPPRPAELDLGTPMPAEGVLFIGEKGKLMAGYYGGKNRLLPQTKFRDYVPPSKTLKRTIGHYKEWVQACKTGSPTNVDFDFGSRMTEIAQLGAIAARCARPLIWDADRMAITNDAVANACVNPPYRAGWSL